MSLCFRERSVLYQQEPLVLQGSCARPVRLRPTVCSAGPGHHGTRRRAHVQRCAQMSLPCVHPQFTLGEGRPEHATWQVGPRGSEILWPWDPSILMACFWPFLPRLCAQVHGEHRVPLPAFREGPRGLPREKAVTSWGIQGVIMPGEGVAPLGRHWRGECFRPAGRVFAGSASSFTWLRSPALCRPLGIERRATLRPGLWRLLVASQTLVLPRLALVAMGLRTQTQTVG